MTEKDLLEALSRVNSKYTDEARERAEAAARKKPRRIMMRTAAAAVGAAACFGLAMFGLSQRKMPEVTVADKDLAEQVTQIVQTSETVTETAVTLPDGVTASPDKHKTTKTVSDNNSRTEATTSAVYGTTVTGTVQTTTAAGTTRMTTVTAASGTTAAPATVTTAPYPYHPVTLNGLTFDFVPSGKTDWISAYDYGLANHVYRAKPGEDLWIDMRLKNNPGLLYGYLVYDLGELRLLDQNNGDGVMNCSIYEGSREKTGSFVSCQFSAKDGKNCEAADDSVLCRMHVRVPDQPGRYSVKVTDAFPRTEFSANTVRGLNTEWYDLLGSAVSDLRKFTFYGLDILVGDVPLPEPAEPINTDLLYRDTFYSEDPEHRREIMWIGLQDLKVYSGQKRVPVGLYIRNNDGLGAMSLSITHASALKGVMKEEGYLLFEPSEAFADAEYDLVESTDTVWRLKYARLGRDVADYQTDGLIGTFYVDVPDDGTVDIGYEYLLTIDVENIEYPDGTPMEFYTLKNSMGLPEAKLQVIG